MAAEDLPSEFDIVILGTGLAESVVAAACSRVGQRVLHLDRRSYYAANWASFTFNSLLTWIQQQQEEPEPEEDQDWSSLLEEGEELVRLSTSASVSNLQVFCFTSEEDEEPEAPSPEATSTTAAEKGDAEETPGAGEGGSTGEDSTETQQERVDEQEGEEVRPDNGQHQCSSTAIIAFCFTNADRRRGGGVATPPGGSEPIRANEEEDKLRSAGEGGSSLQHRPGVKGQC